MLYKWLCNFSYEQVGCVAQFTSKGFSRSIKNFQESLTVLEPVRLQSERCEKSRDCLHNWDFNPKLLFVRPFWCKWEMKQNPIGCYVSSHFDGKNIISSNLIFFPHERDVVGIYIFYTKKYKETNKKYFFLITAFCDV